MEPIPQDDAFRGFLGLWNEIGKVLRQGRLAARTGRTRQFWTQRAYRGELLARPEKVRLLNGIDATIDELKAFKRRIRALPRARR